MPAPCPVYPRSLPYQRSPEPHTLTQLLQPGSIGRPIGNSVMFRSLWEKIMQRRLCMLAIGIGANALAAVSALAQGAPAAAPELTPTPLQSATPPPPPHAAAL